MLANLPKDNPLAECGSNALYYFPEIPCRSVKTDLHDSKRGSFVGRTFDQKDDPLYAEDDLSESEPVRRLIEEAFSNGMEQGRAEVTAAQQAQVDRAAAALEAIHMELARIRRQDLDRMEHETVRLALTIAKKIIGYESRYGEMVTQVVKTAMRKVADPRNVTLKLNPADIETIRNNRPEWLVTEDADVVMRLEADDTIQPGGCIIETHLGDVDARVDSQLKMVEEMLAEQLPQLDLKK